MELEDGVAADLVRFGLPFPVNVWIRRGLGGQIRRRLPGPMCTTMVLAP